MCFANLCFTVASSSSSTSSRTENCKLMPGVPRRVGTLYTRACPPLTPPAPPHNPQGGGIYTRAIPSDYLVFLGIRMAAALLSSMKTFSNVFSSRAANGDEFERTCMRRQFRRRSSRRTSLLFWLEFECRG